MSVLTRTIAVDASVAGEGSLAEESSNPPRPTPQRSSLVARIFKREPSSKSRQVIHLEPSNIILEMMSSTLSSDVSHGELEVHAEIVRQANQTASQPASMRDSAASADAEDSNIPQMPTRLSQLDIQIGNAIGWQPTPLPEGKVTVADKVPVAEMRPKNFFPMDGKKSEITVPTSSADVRAAHAPSRPAQRVVYARSSIRARTHAPPTLTLHAHCTCTHSSLRNG